MRPSGTPGAGGRGEMNAGPILFFDGECGLCARSVAWCLKRDRRGVLRYAPLQGETYARAHGRGQDDLSTMVLLDADGLHTRSDAVLRVLRLVGGLWRFVAAAGGLLPRFARDGVYRWIAARRMWWFGAADRCAAPGAEHRAKFLP